MDDTKAASLGANRMAASEAFRLACLLEASARKPGNVHPQASFHDLRYEDFVRSANAAAPAFADARNRPVGQTVLDAVRRTQATVGKNTNLGIILLIAPLAAVPDNVPLRTGIADVLDALSVEDASTVYEAIRLTAPGGMGQSNEEDIQDTPTVTLKTAMELARDRDSIASEYATNFSITLGYAAPKLADNINTTRDAFGEMPRWEQGVIRLHLELMSQWPDTLIARKRGIGEARKAADLAKEVLRNGWPVSQHGQKAMGELDQWLRAIGNQRNPGTTADLVAAALFVGLLEERILVPDHVAPRAR